MHTYASASQRSLMAGKRTLELLPEWFEHAAALHSSNAVEFGALAGRSNGHMQCQGQGLMWGGSVSCHHHCDSSLSHTTMTHVGGGQ